MHVQRRLARRLLAATAVVGAACLLDTAIAVSAQAPTRYDAAEATAVAAVRAAQHAAIAPPLTVDGHHPRLKGAKVTRNGTPWAEVSRTGADDIPLAALQAYQRAAAVMQQAAPSCKIPWTLLAAIGRVESDHGRFGGSSLGTDGVARPPIYGLPLNGQGPVARIADTDNGALDGDPTWDRAVGPMQIIPGTWQVIAVDGDGNGVRNPQDIDDASLAAAVYLCYGAQGLDTQAGMARAAWHYNPSQSYVATVLAFQHAYATGRIIAASTGTTAFDTHVLATIPTATPTPQGQDGPGPSQPQGTAEPGPASQTPTPAPGKTPPGQPPGPRPTHQPAPQDPQTPTGTPSSPGTPTPPGTPAPPSTPTPPSTPDTPAPPSTPDPPSTPPPPPPPPPDTPTPSDPPPPTDTPPPPTDTPPPPTDTPPATASPGPVLTSLTGTWHECAGSTAGQPEYCLDGTTLDLGPASQLAALAAADFDGDGQVQTNAAELAGLVGRSLTVQVAGGTDPAVVHTIGGFAYRSADGSFVPPQTGTNGS